MVGFHTDEDEEDLGPGAAHVQEHERLVEEERLLAQRLLREGEAHAQRDGAPHHNCTATVGVVLDGGLAPPEAGVPAARASAFELKAPGFTPSRTRAVDAPVSSSQAQLWQTPSPTGARRRVLW